MIHRHHKKTLRALGASLKLARQKAHLSIPKLASLCNVSQGNISKIEHGGNTTVLTLYKICWTLGAHPAKVLPPFIK